MSKVLLTGASGFIGTHVRRALWESGHEIVSLVRAAKPELVPYPNERIVLGTLTEPHILERELTGTDLDFCVHLAWEGIPDYSSQPSMKNLEYGFCVLRLCKTLKIKGLIMAGSCWEYLNPVGMVQEDAALSYENPFKAAKNTLHLMSREFCRENGIAIHWLRFFYVYGEGQRSGSLIPYIVDALKSGVQPALNGAFHQNDFVHVSDVAQAVCKSLEHTQSYSVLNIGSGDATRVLDIAMETAQIFHMPFDCSQYKPPTAIPHGFWTDIRRAEAQLGWYPRVSIQEGIERCIKFANEGKR